MTQPSKNSDKSKITLKTYVNILRRASNGSLPERKALSEHEWRLVRELMDSGLLSDARSSSGPAVMFSYIAITPDGAMALESWSNYLKESSVWFKAGESFIRFLWLIAGALCASITDILGYLNA